MRVLAAVWWIAGVWANETDPGAGFAQLAEMRLSQGQNLLALDVARQCLEKFPEHVACRKIHARALVQVGHCERALGELAHLRRQSIWEGRLAMGESICRIRTGDIAAAEAALDEAALFQGTDAASVFERGLVRLRVGDIAGAIEQLPTLWYEEDPILAELLEAWIFVEQRSPAADGALAQLIARREDLSHLALSQIRLLECRRWLDLGGHDEAAEVAGLGLTLANGNPRIAACRAEAWRRGGDPFQALEVTSRPWHQGVSLPAMVAIRIRAMVDLGRLADAAKELAEMRVFDSDSAASAWYLARAKGDELAMRNAAAQFTALSSPGASLEALRPEGVAW